MIRLRSAGGGSLKQVRVPPWKPVVLAGAALGLWTAPLFAQEDEPLDSTEPAAPARERPPLGDDEVEPGSAPSDTGLETQDAESYRRLVLAVMVDLTVPIGNTADFISSAGLQGFTLDVRYHLTENWAIGVSGGFDGLSEKTSEPFVWNELTIDAVQTRQRSFTPLVAKGVYAFRNEGLLLPYVAAGAGVARNASRILVGVSRLTDQSWHPAIVPEAGALLQVGNTVLVGSLRLHYLPGTQAAEAETFVNVSLGVAVQ